MRIGLRSLFLGFLFSATLARAIAGAGATEDASAEFRRLEGPVGGRLGVAALRVSDGKRLEYRANESFPFCSTFKVLLVADLLARSVHDADLGNRLLRYSSENLVSYSPVTKKRLESGMTVFELCAATIQYSDNTAANLLIELAGGPPSVTRYARSLGNESFRLDRMEIELNSAVPGDLRDTVSPRDMTDCLNALLLGDALPASQRKTLLDWMLGNTTGAKRIRAAVPENWRTADKTGTGYQGTFNDIAVLLPPEGSPIVLSLYYTREKPTDRFPEGEALLREATAIVLRHL